MTNDAMQICNDREITKKSHCIYDHLRNGASFDFKILITGNI